MSLEWLPLLEHQFPLHPPGWQRSATMPVQSCWKSQIGMAPTYWELKDLKNTNRSSCSCDSYQILLLFFRSCYSTKISKQVKYADLNANKFFIIHQKYSKSKQRKLIYYWEENCWHVCSKGYLLWSIADWENPADRSTSCWCPEIWPGPSCPLHYPACLAVD